jgi:uncharacterized membrane protein YeiH
MTTFHLALDLAGTFVFALSGGIAGVKYRLDIFGVLVLSFVAGNTGGIIRDVLIGATPPLAVSDWRYLATSLFAGMVTFFRHGFINRMHSPVQVFDAMGLALFAVTGADRALVFHLGPVAAAILGMLTGIGGGMARDVLTAKIPTVLCAELYAIAALAGAVVVVVGHELQWPSTVATLTGGMLCFVLRFLAIRRGWRLPRADGTKTSHASE